METNKLTTVTVAKNYLSFLNLVHSLDGVFSLLKEEDLSIDIKDDGNIVMKAVYTKGTLIYSVTCVDDMQGVMREKNVLLKTPHMEEAELLTWKDAAKRYYDAAFDKMQKEVLSVCKNGAFSPSVQRSITVDDYGVSVKIDAYDVSLQEGQIEEILERDYDISCSDYFHDCLANLACEMGPESYEYTDFVYELKKQLAKNEVIKCDMEAFLPMLSEILNEIVSFEFDSNEIDPEIRVNLMIDSGNHDYDCCCDDLLSGHQPEERLKYSSVMYIAELCGKKDKFLSALANSKEDAEDPFVKSVIDELDNNPYPNGSTMTVLAKMPLSDVIKIVDCREGYAENVFVKIPKNAECGLFNKWNGSGSCLEVELPKDICIPADRIVVQYENPCRKGHYGTYTVDEVYGLVSSVWRSATVA